MGGRELTEDKDDLPELPNGWIWTNLETIAVLVTGKTPSTIVEDYWNGEIPFVTPSEIAPEGNIRVSQRTLTLLGAKKARILPKDSILIVCIGTVGKVGILNQSSVINQQLNALLPLEFIFPKFLYYWSKYFIKPWVISNASATVNASILNKSRLGKAPAPLAPLNEQRRLVTKIESLKARTARVKDSLSTIPALLDQFRQSVLAAAFRGALVPQDPNDEPASVLLERIHAEREKNTGATSKRSKKSKPVKESIQMELELE